MYCTLFAIIWMQICLYFNMIFYERFCTINNSWSTLRKLCLCCLYKCTYTIDILTFHNDINSSVIWFIVSNCRTVSMADEGIRRDEPGEVPKQVSVSSSHAWVRRSSLFPLKRWLIVLIYKHSIWLNILHLWLLIIF